MKKDGSRSWLATRGGVILLLLGPCLMLLPRCAGAADGTLEPRIVTDSTGCPVAVEVWLTAASDTVNGVEVALLWNRPDFARFLPASTKPPAADTLADTVRRLVTPRASGQAALERRGTLMEDWDYAEARILAGGGVKVTAVARLVPARHGTPIMPGRTGPLFRLPVAPVAATPGAPAADTAALWLERGKTRLSDSRGTLFRSLELKSVVISTAGLKCAGAHRTQPKPPAGVPSGG